MITVKHLRKILAKLPDEAQVSAYEGEDTGLIVTIPGHKEENLWIRARGTDEEDDQKELAEIWMQSPKTTSSSFEEALRLLRTLDLDELKLEYSCCPEIGDFAAIEAYLKSFS